MRAAETLVGLKLDGKKIPGNWEVTEKIERQGSDTGGRFSVGYKIKHDNGRQAFMKASDCSLLANDGDDILGKTAAGIMSFKSEIQILEYCRGNNMDRVVTPIDYGECMYEHNGVKEPLFWIIFELAATDARRQLNSSTALDFTWALHAMHNLCVAVRQLHAADVAHNDIKPSNVLVFDELVQKLGDLGSATSPKFISANDSSVCAGDPGYAPPESLYENPNVNAALSFNRRRAGELYMLGSMAVFLLSAPMTTTYVLSKLDPIHRPRNSQRGWTGDVEGVLPYWDTAFSEMLIDIEQWLPRTDDGQITPAGIEYLEAVRQLCSPDMSRRGHPINIENGGDQYSVERYISLFDRLRKRAMVPSVAA